MISDESAFWANFPAEISQIIQQTHLMSPMNIKEEYFCSHSHQLKINNTSILDIGGGGVSMLLRKNNVKTSARHAVIDPCKFLPYHYQRYVDHNIELINDKAENMDSYFPQGSFDECWIYNCLQHVVDPELIIEKASKIGKIIRICEPLHAGRDDGHYHNFEGSFFTNILARYKCHISTSVEIHQQFCDAHFYIAKFERVNREEV